MGFQEREYETLHFHPAENFISGIEIAKKSIASGAAYEKLKSLIKKSKGDLSKLEEMETKYG